MSKHTPGPWHLEETSQAFIITKGPDPFDEQITDHVYTKENAQLIAEAPDLLAALIVITDKYANEMESEYCSTERDLPEVLAARTAIARAQGEA